MALENQDITGIQQEKKVFRDKLELRAFPPLQTGKSSELLRRHAIYKSTRQIFVSPVPALHQVRVNCLLDGKELIMASAGLKEGFFLVKPYSIPFRDLSFAVTLKGLPRFAQKLSQAEVRKLQIGIVASDALAVDPQGGRLGDGLGFFDLSYAILKTMGALTGDVKTAIFVSAGQVVSSPLPVSSWDVPADLIVTEQEMKTVAKTYEHSGQIFWEHLSGKKIKKMTPLWWLKNEKR